MFKNNPNDQSLFSHFVVIKDPRIERKKQHDLMDIFVIAICASICGAETWTEMEDFGHSKKQWFEKILNLKNGIPLHDTFRRFFILVNPEEFSRAFYSWVCAVNKTLMKNDQICIDGKALRGSIDYAKRTSTLHMVNAWSSGVALSLGQLKSDGKSNEITTIPKLLDILNIKGCIVSTDAMGCQTKIAEKIIKKEGDYCFGLKGNQPTLEATVKEMFNQSSMLGDGKLISSVHIEESEGHGRLETRECKVITAKKGKSFDAEILKAWPGLNSLIEITSTRMNLQTWIVSKEKRYYISSVKDGGAEFLLSVIRKHWGIENNLHWQLDVSIREDECRSREGHSPENFSLLRHITLNLLKSEPTKISINRKRKKSGWDEEFLLKVLLNDGKSQGI